MNLTSKSRYALKVMLDLARFRHESSVKRQDIARRQGIPAKYLDQILIRLRREGLAESIRGRAGGYRLGKEPGEISIWDIFRAVEDGIYPVECVDEHESHCDFQNSCVAGDAWQLIFASMRRLLNDMSLAEFEKKFASDQKMCPLGGVRECKPGREPIRETVAVTLDRESSQ